MYKGCWEWDVDKDKDKFCFEMEREMESVVSFLASYHSSLSHLCLFVIGIRIGDSLMEVGLHVLVR